jgi:hypothetical protein
MVAGFTNKFKSSVIPRPLRNNFCMLDYEFLRLEPLKKYASSTAILCFVFTDEVRK